MKRNLCICMLFLAAQGMADYSYDPSFGHCWYYLNEKSYTVQSLVPETGAKHNASYKGCSYTKSINGHIAIDYLGQNKKVVTPPSSVNYNGCDYPVYNMCLDGGGSFGSASPDTWKIVVPEGVLEARIRYFPNVTEIVLPKSLRKIKIYHCYKLKNLVLPENLRTIEGSYGYASELSSLEEIVIPPSVEEIGAGAFYGCGIKDLTIPSTVKYCEARVCAECFALTNVCYNPSYTLGNGAFDNSRNLEKVVIGDDVIGFCSDCNPTGGADRSPFLGCSALKDVSMGVKITGRLPNKLCSGLTMLTNFVCRGEVTGIGDSCFSGATKLGSFETAGDITSVGSSSFYSCYELQNLNLSNCQTIGNSAFHYCSSLTGELNIEKVSSLGSQAFRSCTGIDSIKTGNGLYVLPTSAFENCNKVTNISLVAVRDIGSCAFRNCRSLQSISIPKAVTNISEQAFQYCYSLSAVYFDGEPPAAASSAFSSVSSGARGYYRSAYEEEWKAAVDANGKWRGLQMMPLNDPVLSIKSADIPNDTMTLSWSLPQSGKVRVHRNSVDDFCSATCIGEGYDLETYTEKDYMKITPACNSLYYWISVEDASGKIIRSNSVKARTRYGLSVGYSKYNTAEKALIQAYYDASFFRSLCINYAGVESSNAFLLSNANATTEKIRKKLSEMSKAMIPGDLLLFYIATHGGNFYKVDDSYRQAALATYDGLYNIGQLQTDVRAFSPSVGIIMTVMACHSQSLTSQPTAGGDEEFKSTIDNWLSRCGFASCLGNVAWISSCGSNENSYNSSIYTMFGQVYLNDGWAMRYADAELVNCDYGGGDRDGLVTMLEVAKYSQEFYRGYSDKQCSHVQYENEGLLSNVIVNSGSVPATVRPSAPYQVSASQGASNRRIQVDWSRVASAVTYRVYREEVGTKDAVKECVCNACSRMRIIDDDVLLTLNKPYRYSVRAVSRSGVSEESPVAIGRTGLPAFLNFLELFGQLYTDAQKTPENYEAARKTIGSNGFSLEDSFVAGLNPQNEESKFEVNIDLVGGIPVITWSPDLKAGDDGLNRRYTTMGKKDLRDDEWAEVDLGDEASFNFFKVKVELDE